MATTRWHKPIAAGGLAVLVIASSWLARPSQGHPRQVVAQAKADRIPTKSYYGVSRCSDLGCHSTPDVGKQKDIILCDYDEVLTWSKKDKHNDAYKVLNEERGRQMAKLLGYDVAKSPLCISCHAAVVKNENIEKFTLSEGVGCGACHGFHDDWITPHGLERPKWRGLSRKVKEEQYGMRDLWDPEKRAVLCASCHIGNAKEGKVVTHEMYAVGHPPLPSIEMATFADAMPKHWKYLAEKPKKVQTILEYDAAKSGLERSQFVVVAALVSFRESMKLLADQAEADKDWPELAQFDCNACHHDLKADSWRQKRGYAGKPGRPTKRAWVDALLPLAITHASKGDAEQKKKLNGEFDDKKKELTAAFDAQPFGDPKRVAESARQAAKWADGVLNDIRNTSVDHAGAEKLLDELGKQAQSRLLDFDSARQLTWAFREIMKETDPQGFKNQDTVSAFKELEQQLKLDLPEGRKEIAKDYLKDWLESLNKFEPEPFQQSFKRLFKKVKEDAK